MLKTRTIVAALTVLAVTAGCNNSGPAAPVEGCTLGSTKELYVQVVHDCPDGTRVYQFASDEARDDYLKIANHFGAVTVATGPSWAKVRTP